jgi:hypothetical protein
LVAGSATAVLTNLVGRCETESGLNELQEGTNKDAVRRIARQRMIDQLAAAEQQRKQ